jgi:FdhD protein
MDQRITSKKDVLVLSKDDGNVVSEKASKEVIVESKVDLILNGKSFVSLLCLKEYVEELVIGFLYNEGLINEVEELSDIEVCKDQHTVYVKLREDIDLDDLRETQTLTSGCGKGRSFINPEKSEIFKFVDSTLKLSIEEIWAQTKEFNTHQSLHKTVGGVHSCLLKCGDYQVFCEDIGRHNCLDKIAGIMLKANKNSSLSESVLISSGRISSEMMTKIVRMGIPILVSVSAPTEMAVDFAEKYNITLLGYVRGSRATVYAGQDRLIC